MTDISWFLFLTCEDLLQVFLVFSHRKLNIWGFRAAFGPSALKAYCISMFDIL